MNAITRETTADTRERRLFKTEGFSDVSRGKSGAYRQDFRRTKIKRAFTIGPCGFQRGNPAAGSSHRGWRQRPILVNDSGTSWQPQNRAAAFRASSSQNSWRKSKMAEIISASAELFLERWNAMSRNCWPLPFYSWRIQTARSIGTTLGHSGVHLDAQTQQARRSKPWQSSTSLTR